MLVTYLFYAWIMVIKETLHILLVDIGVPVIKITGFKFFIN